MKKREYAGLRDPVNRTNECLQQIVSVLYICIYAAQTITNEYRIFCILSWTCMFIIYMQGTLHKHYILGSINMMIAITSMYNNTLPSIE